ncbi:(d)CMP kinase [Rickettsiales endosymbiont of Peranema trichophorum]|nr:(d)CMP kinase [Rickettsiales endosymbiont of Peranema trichophorum]
MGIVIAIDGDAASGKGLLSQALANRLGFDYLDTGKLYRRLAHYLLQHGLNHNDTDMVVSVLPLVNFSCHLQEEELQSASVASVASLVATYPLVRDFLNRIQIEFPLNKKGAVLDGRDIGTVVIPNADVKFFITANIEVRAERRFKQLQRMGKDIIFSEVLENLIERDNRDKNRSVAPALPADDAIVVDTSSMTAEQVLDYALKSVYKILTNKNLT